MKKLSKKETEKKIEEFFSDIKIHTPLSIKKIRKTAMNYKVNLGEKRKLFCKKCFLPYGGKEKVRINRGRKSVTCNNCGYIARWKIKLS
ncbi:MAG: hypothetical protein KGH55_00760 [Nanoarchaeota archaeon]|nr:hypothetical protein [Nanoarchaeota archaeon]